MRNHRVLTGAAALVAVTAIGGVVAMSGAEQATPTAQEPPVNTATVERGKLFDMVSQRNPDLSGGIGRSPCTVINRARGTYTTFQAASEACGGPGEGDTNTQTGGGAP